MPRFARAFVPSSPASTTNTGWRATRTASFRANFTAPWRMPAGSASPCRRNMAASGLGVTEAAIMMHEVASHGGGMAASSAVHINLFGPHPIVVKGTDDAETSLGSAPRFGRGPMLLRFHRAGRRAEHHAHQDLRRKGARRLPRARTEGLDLDRAGRQQDHAADAHHQVRGLQTADRRHHHLLHRSRSFEDRSPPHSEDGPQGRGLQRHLHRRPVHSGSGPHRRGGQGLLLHPAQPQSRADPDRGRGDRHRPGRAAPRHALRARTHRVRPSDRPEPGHPASAGGTLDVSGGGVADGDARRLALRHGQALRRRGQQREVSRRARRPRRRPAGHHDPWRLRLRQGVSRRAAVPRGRRSPASRRSPNS